MKLVLAQLVSAYESDPGGSETVAALAKAFDLEPEIVAATLQTHSATYRMRQMELRGEGFVTNNPHGEHPVEDVSADVKNEMLGIINEIARNVDVPAGVRLKAAIRQVDEHKKRLDRVVLKDGMSNVLVINNHFAELKKEREARRKLQVVDVKPVETPAEVVYSI